jgi:hypothetical protein
VGGDLQFPLGLLVIGGAVAGGVLPNFQALDGYRSAGVVSTAVDAREPPIAEGVGIVIGVVLP